MPLLVFATSVDVYTLQNDFDDLNSVAVHPGSVSHSSLQSSSEITFWKTLAEEGFFPSLLRQHPLPSNSKVGAAVTIDEAAQAKKMVVAKAVMLGVSGVSGVLLGVVFVV